MVHSIIPRWTARLEKVLCRFPFLVNAYSLPYQKVVAREVALAGISSEDAVLVVGCGAAPFTAIEVARQTGARVQAVDVDPFAVEGARRAIRSLGLQSQIDVVLADASMDVPPDFSVALVALQAAPKVAIFQTLCRRGMPHSRLVFRVAATTFESHYDALSVDMVPTGETSQNMKTFDRSLLFAVNGDPCGEADCHADVG